MSGVEGSGSAVSGGSAPGPASDPVSGTVGSGSAVPGAEGTGVSVCVPPEGAELVGAWAARLSSRWPVVERREPSALTDMMSRSLRVKVS